MVISPWDRKGHMGKEPRGQLRGTSRDMERDQECDIVGHPRLSDYSLSRSSIAQSYLF